MLYVYVSVMKSVYTSLVLFLKLGVAKTYEIKAKSQHYSRQTRVPNRES